MTNVAVIGTVIGKRDYVLADELVHASIIDGCQMSRAEVLRFKHNDCEDLALKLSTLPAHARKLIVADAVYSMDGDIAPLPDLIRVRNSHENTILMVDEAHSLGVLGRCGRGIEEHFGCSGKVDLLMGTLSKTIPAQGGYVAGSHELITYLRYNARGFIFSASLSPVAAAASLAAFDVIEQEGASRQLRLGSNVRYFVQRLRDEGFRVGATASAIVPVLLGNEALAFEMAKRCNDAGIYVMPVVYPAVAKGTERLRLNITCNHRRVDLDYAVNVLRQAFRRGL
jgi:glycine C-acetyltransferase